MHASLRSPILLALLALLVSRVHAQVTLPRVAVNSPGNVRYYIVTHVTGCQARHTQGCRMDCPRQYHDETRYLCPCYSKLAQCLVRLGCSVKQKRDIFAFCTRKGYCKDGYCKFREGDLASRGDNRPEVFELTSVKTPDVPCIDACCPSDSSCAQNTSLISVREPGRGYRKQERYLPPRHGDPRLGVNQAYDRMPYSIPVENLS